MLHKFPNTITAAIAAILLAACGGGGGGGGNISQPPVSSNSWLQFTPPNLNLTAYEGRETEFSVNAKSSKTIAQAFNIGVFESTGLISTKVELKKISDLEYSVALQTAENLKAGTYNSKLEVRLCLDNPVTCARPVEGSPWSLPLSVTVKPATNLSALSDIPSLGPWTTAGGNIARTNYAPVRLDPLKFSQRWNYDLPIPGEGRPSTVMSANGIAFVLTSESGNTYLRALEESSGRVLWTNTERYSSLSNLSLSGDKLYIVNHGADIGGHSLLDAYDQKTGKSLFRTVLERVDSSNKPLIVNGAVFLHGPTGVAGTLTATSHISKVDANTGALLVRKSMEMASAQTLAADGQYIYAFAYGKLAIISQSTLEVVSESPDAGSCSYGRQNVLSTAGMIFDQCYGRLTAYNTVTPKKAWELTGDYDNTIAVAGGTVYAVKADILEARAAADGALLWSTPLTVDGTRIIGGTVLATDNLVFVSGSRALAIDTTSHQIVWTFPQGGAMSISSNGVLYLTQSILGSGRVGNVVAINLR